MPAWSEQDALESLHKVLAEKVGEILMQRGCKMMLLCCTALPSTDAVPVLKGLDEFEVLTGDEGERLHVHAPI